jgi:hypothetical protein
MATQAWAIKENGTLVVDTVRLSPGDAKLALISLRKCQGRKWKDYEKAGCRLVQVRVRVIPEPPTPERPKRDPVQPSPAAAVREPVVEATGTTGMRLVGRRAGRAS